MITIFLNETALTITPQLSLAALLQQHEQKNSCFAIAVNQQFISRTHYHETLLKDGDRILIITPMQGG